VDGNATPGEEGAMIQLFEAIMTAILAYMAYAIFEGHASSAVLGILIVIQSLFWGLDFLFVRGGVDDLAQMRRVARKISRSLSRA
jgi:hypothetical protein